MLGSRGASGPASTSAPTEPIAALSRPARCHAARRNAQAVRSRRQVTPCARLADRGAAPPSTPTRREEMRQTMSAARQQMADNPELQTLMAGLRGSNTDDSDFAADNVRMNVIDSFAAATSDDALPLVYDPDAIARFWGRRPGAVAQRILQLLSISGRFLSNLAFDALRGKLSETEVARAVELREIVTSLGPAYIKLGQALSIRPDLLSPPAMRELQKLCDKVPSFPNETAMGLIEAELGAPWQAFFAELGPDPVAAASLGQVYKGTLLTTGETVAVKVQRPYVLETVTVDLFVIRRLGVFLRRFPDLSLDVVGLLDEWAARFFEELDYVKEGQNATAFAASMAVELPQIVVPRTFPQYTARRVLVSSWLEGEKLSQSSAADVGDLVAVGVVCYLRQLLVTGNFHADPHPGNLIRTPDGRLAILDFGLMTEISDDIKYGMIEAIAHLIHRDYEKIVQDFVTLDFISPDVDLKPLLPVLARVFDAALEGGGARNFNFQELAADLAQITFDYPFRIPPYFALIIRAIGVLEGIALVGNPGFALVDEAYPFLASRMLTDDSPRLRAALTYMVYGRSSVFDADRLIEILESYEAFVTVSKMGSTGHLALPEGRPAPPPAATALLLAPPPQPSSRQALQFLLAPEGMFFREFITDELVKGIDAAGRVQAADAVAALGLANLQLPLLLPFSSARSFSLAPAVTADDRAIMANVAKLLAFFGGSRLDGTAPISPAMVQELLALAPSLAAEMGPQIASKLGSRVAARFIREVVLEPVYR